MLFFLQFGLPVHVWYILKGKNGKPFLSLKEFHIWVHRIRNIFYWTFFKKACGGSFCTRMQNINKSIECYDHMLPQELFCFFLLILCLNLENARWTSFVNHGKHPPFIITTVIFNDKLFVSKLFSFAHLSLIKAW